MRIVFAGATALGWRCCQELGQVGQEVVGIMSIPQEFKISYAPGGVRNVTYRSFADLAASYQAPLFQVEQGRTTPELLEFLKAVQGEMMLVVGWYYMVPKTVRRLFPKGVLGIHASLLPKYRGGAPLTWAMINGEPETGVSAFFFEDGVDTGDVLARRRFAIDYSDTIKDLLEKTEAASLSIVREEVPRYGRGEIKGQPQDHRQAFEVPQRGPEDGMIDWRRSSRQVYDWVRSQTKPYPGAFFLHRGRKIKVWAVSEERRALESGKIKMEGEDVLVGVDGGCVRLVEFSLIESDETEASRDETVRFLRHEGSA